MSVFRSPYNRTGHLAFVSLQPNDVPLLCCFFDCRSKHAGLKVPFTGIIFVCKIPSFVTKVKRDTHADITVTS